MSIVENILDNPQVEKKVKVSLMFDYNAIWSVPTLDSEGETERTINGLHEGSRHAN